MSRLKSLAFPICESLDSLRNIPVVQHEDGLLSVNNPNYKKVHQLFTAGFEFTLTELLHAVGVKLGRIDPSHFDEAMFIAYALLKNIEHDKEGFGFATGIDSDDQTDHSRSVGLGMSYLFASKIFGIPWSNLHPIPGPGKRFDLQGQSGSLTAVLEAKGTTSKNSQRGQIQNGLRKKHAFRARGQSFDIELIISTCIGLYGNPHRIMVADPPMDGAYFGERALKFVHARHLAKVMNFAGFHREAREWLAISSQLRPILEKKERLDYLDEWANHSFKLPFEVYTPQAPDKPYEEASLVYGDKRYVGRWIENAYSTVQRFDAWTNLARRRAAEELSFRKEFNSRIESLSTPNYRLFQGIREDFLEKYRPRQILYEHEFETSPIPTEHLHDPGECTSVFPDGTILKVEPLEN